MPDFWTHILAGEKLIEGLEERTWCRLIEKNRHLFNFGCQGPDFLFYNDFWPWIKEKRGPEVGHELHQNNVSSLFIGSIDYLKKIRERDSKKFSLLLVYFTGFLTHYMVDKWTHPFINLKIKDSVEHKYLESRIDAYLINKRWGRDVHRLSPVKLIELGQDIPTAVINFYKQILISVHAYPAEINYINDSYRDFKWVLNFFSRHSRIKRHFFKILDSLLPLDLSSYDLFYPTEVDYQILSEREYGEFMLLFNKAINEGLILIKLIDDYFSGKTDRREIEQAFPEISFSGISG